MIQKKANRTRGTVGGGGGSWSGEVGVRVGVAGMKQVWVAVGGGLNARKEGHAGTIRVDVGQGRKWEVVRGV